MTRTEKDSMGEMQVPPNALYGAQTARAIENFDISGRRFGRSFIRALCLIKGCSARTNRSLGLLDEKIAGVIIEAAEEGQEGRLDAHFVLDIFQTGSGTSTNMNANEVIANRAVQLLGHKIGARSIHPNDQVNLCQSSNDVIPTAIHMAAACDIQAELIPALKLLHQTLAAKADTFDDIIKIGRTHLQDATPVRLGQVFGGYARQAELGIRRVGQAAESLLELPLGGTAVGTGINCHPDFPARTIAAIARQTALPFREAANHFEAQGARDALVEVSGALKALAVSLFKIANDIRFLSSGPRCGLGELKLPAVQPGSSIMPGKVNPVMAESLMQVCAQVIGNDAAISLGGLSGNFELNTMMPLMAHNLLQSIELLSRGVRAFDSRCLRGLSADEQGCARQVEQSLAMVTALAPKLGYDRAAALAKEAHRTDKTIRELLEESGELGKEELERLLDPARMTEPGLEP